eukprot:GEMP01017566.1.p1 GENE.GEMP01017566.1~~GEMP01017566.1.p1  ORF type:complete len:804 (+),score=242.05 GEMP01017566.1:161-2572(+)
MRILHEMATTLPSKQALPLGKVLNDVIRDEPPTKAENFVDRMVLEEKRVIHRVFNVIDANNNGYMEREELKKALHSMGFERQTRDACDRVFDSTGMTRISANDFYSFMSKKVDGNDAKVQNCLTAFLNVMQHNESTKSGSSNIVTMNFGRLANLDKPVSKLIYSTANLVDAPHPTAVLDKAWASGCNTFECAPDYGLGEAEQIVGNWIRNAHIERNDLVLIVRGNSAASLTESLRRLQTDYADVFVLCSAECHEGDIAHVTDTMSKLQTRGACNAWGVEKWSTDMITTAIKYAKAANINGPLCDVVRHSLVDATQQILAPMVGSMTAERKQFYTTYCPQVAVLASECLADGFLCGKLSSGSSKVEWKESALNGVYLRAENYSRRARVAILATSKNLTPSQIAIAYVLSQQYTSFAVVKTTDPEYFSENANATNVTLSADEMHFLAHGTTPTVVTKEVITPAEILNEQPVSAQAAFTVFRARKDIAQIIAGEDDRAIAITGPCSIHDPIAALEYAKELKKFADAHKEDLVVVMRAYFEKPRTTVGWKGLLDDPDLDGSCDINKGLRVCRNVLMRINELGLPCAVELLSNMSGAYFSDLVSWAAIGARTTESQIHREMVSSMPDIPVGFKNGTQGNVDIALDAMQCATAPHTFLAIGQHGRVSIAASNGNTNSHIILRGGKQGPNFSAQHVAECDRAMSKKNMRKRLIIDCSHGNSNKDHKNQPKVIADIARQLVDGSYAIGGVMIESNLIEGAQKLEPGKTDLLKLKYGQSVTDACVDMPTTDSMFVELAQGVKRRRLHKQAMQ